LLTEEIEQEVQDLTVSGNVLWRGQRPQPSVFAMGQSLEHLGMGAEVVERLKGAFGDERFGNSGLRKLTRVLLVLKERNPGLDFEAAFDGFLDPDGDGLPTPEAQAAYMRTFMAPKRGHSGNMKGFFSACSQAFLYSHRFLLLSVAQAHGRAAEFAEALAAALPGAVESSLACSSVQVLFDIEFDGWGGRPSMTTLPAALMDPLKSSCGLRIKPPRGLLLKAHLPEAP